MKLLTKLCVFAYPCRRRASSLESQLNSFIHQFALGSRRGSGRRLVRSHSDSHISYSVCEAPEAPGTAEYIKTDGQLNVKIVFKVGKHKVSG